MAADLSRAFEGERPAGSRGPRRLRSPSWAVALFAAALLQPGVLTHPASAAPAASDLAVTSVGGNPAVILPTGYDVRRLAHDVAEQRRLTRAAVAAVETSRVVQGNSAETEAEREHWDSVILFVDADGNVVRPDAERAGNAASVSAGDLSFTFDSPAHPFTPEQISNMRAWIAEFYPVVKSLYGPPAFANTVNVSFNPTISAAGVYSSGSNEIILADPSAVDALVHEMIHAFHDDDMIASQWEETMTRAAEVAAFNQLGVPHWDAHHSYYYDVWVDALDAQTALGSESMSIYDGPNLLMSYNVGGYEWWKVFHAYPRFFSDFNGMLYAHPDWANEEAALVEMAAAAAPTVEGLPFSMWYITHGIFNSAPPLGYQFVMSGDFGGGWLVNRFGGSGARPVPGVSVSWHSQDVNGRVLAAGTTTTSATGFASVTKDPIPGTYTGRGLLTFTASVGTQTVTGSAWMTRISQEGVFGIAPRLNSGTVTVTSLDDPGSPPVAVPLVKGAFHVPSLATAIGRFRATLTRSDGTIAARRVFTKDASPYLVILEPRPAPVVNLKTAAVDAPATVLQGAEMYPAVTARNRGPSTAPPSSSRLLLSKNSTRDAGDIQSPTLARLPAIASGAQVQAWATFPVPATTPPGTYRLLSCTDDNQLIAESDETDNCLAGPTVTVVAPAPNLRVVSVRTPPSAARRGTTFTVGDTTRNLGQLSASASRSRYLLSHDKTRGASDVLLTPRRQLARLAPGADSSGSVVVTIPGSTPTGLYWVLACADDTHVVAESNEADNCRASKAQITIRA